MALIGLADFVLIPTGATFDDRRSTIPWMGVMKHHGKEAAFVMNRVKRSTVAFREAKKLLLKEGRLCPAEIPDLRTSMTSPTRAFRLWTSTMPAVVTTAWGCGISFATR